MRRVHVLARMCARVPACECEVMEAQWCTLGMQRHTFSLKCGLVQYGARYDEVSTASSVCSHSFIATQRSPLSPAQLPVVH